MGELRHGLGTEAGCGEADDGNGDDGVDLGQRRRIGILHEKPDAFLGGVSRHHGVLVQKEAFFGHVGIDDLRAQVVELQLLHEGEQRHGHGPVEEARLVELEDGLK